MTTTARVKKTKPKAIKAKAKKLPKPCGPKPCGSCQDTKTTYRRRGLCRQCFRDEATRKQAPRYGKAVPDHFGPAAPNGKPKRKERAKHFPGDPRKIDEFAARAENRQELHSQYDRVRKVNLN